MLKHALTAAALTAVLASPAFAQANKADPMAKPNSAAESSMPSKTMMNTSATGHETFVQDQHATDWRGSKLIGATIYGPDNASIGDINDLLIGNDGQVRAVVIGVGGFLGVGEKNVAIPLDALNIRRRADSTSIDKITVSYTKDQIKSAPKFAFYEPGKATTTGSNVNDSKTLNPTDMMKNKNDTIKK